MILEKEKKVLLVGASQVRMMQAGRVHGIGHDADSV